MFLIGLDSRNICTAGRKRRFCINSHSIRLMNYIKIMATREFCSVESIRGTMAFMVKYRNFKWCLVPYDCYVPKKT